MVLRIRVFLAVVFITIFVATAVTNNQDYVALTALKNEWKNTPPNWVRQDPCGRSWDGIQCTSTRVTSIILPSMGLIGQLSGDILQLTELRTLDLSYNSGLTGPLLPAIGDFKDLINLYLISCGFSGPIPYTIGSLQNLQFLSLNSNSFSGQIPASIGNLSNLYWLDLADNKLSGSIPISNGTTPGLDLLVNTKHFHFGNNKLSGELPSQLFSSNMTLIHLLCENNQFSGKIPNTLVLVKSLETVRLDRNSFSGPIPTNLSNLGDLNVLFLSNNQLTGSLPDLTGLSFLNYLSLGDNSFDASDFPSWVLTLQSLTSLFLQNTGLQGVIPVTLFALPQLQTLELKNNRLNGTLDVGSSYSSQLEVIDLQNNSITVFTDRGGLNVTLILIANPICKGSGNTQSYCSAQLSNTSYSTPPNNCVRATCNSDQVSSPNCTCAYPYTGTFIFRAPSFSDFGSSSVYTSLQTSLMSCFQAYQLPVDSVSLNNPTINANDYLVVSLEVFPSGQVSFNRTGVSEIGFVLSNQTFKPPDSFGPYYFNASKYNSFAGSAGTTKSSSTGVIVGAAVGGSVLLLLAIIAGLYAFRFKKRAEKADRLNNPFAGWDQNKSSGDVPQLKGANFFSFEEMKKCTNNFSEANSVGSGGYGKVYRGTLPLGKLVAIKRAQQGSMQGAVEFKTEIELLSRVHHKNLVSLVGFCFAQGEQMLVYEYIPNGTLMDGLSGNSGITLDWMRRLRIALGAARGLQYLHELADPPIIHRDIKSNNILLDENLTAKVADFGLSKPMSDSERTHITTQVKGTMGYMDPEYYMTQQLTEKSDVYGFGIVMLELITARHPIEKGKHIVREIRLIMDKTQGLYNLHELVDPALSGTKLIGFDKFVDLAMSCVEESGANRPSMGRVVQGIENIMQIAGLNPNADSASTSATYEGDTKGNEHPYNEDDSLFIYSGVFPTTKIEPL